MHVVQIGMETEVRRDWVSIQSTKKLTAHHVKRSQISIITSKLLNNLSVLSI